MYSQDEFLSSIKSFLSSESSGALMISGAWGSGKTYYVKNTLCPHLEGLDRLPIIISLFGLSQIDGLERCITETFLQKYGEDKLTSSNDKETSNDKEISKISKRITNFSLHKKSSSLRTLAEVIPYIGQYINIGRALETYIAMCTPRLPKDKLVVILDDLERAVKTIPSHILLGVINNLMESKDYKVILIANDSYFSVEDHSYLDFKEKVIERSLLFPTDILTIYNNLINRYESKFKQLMSTTGFVNIINPETDTNKNDRDLYENLNNIRILKFSIAQFAKVYEALSSIDEEDSPQFEDFLKSLWALTVGLSIEYKRNRISYLDREDFIRASNVDSFVIDVDNQQIQNTVEEENQANTVEKIRGIFKQYIERHSLPLVSCHQIFDLITAGIPVSTELMYKHWDEYRKMIESQKANPAVQLLNCFMFSLSTFSNKEFPERLDELADRTEKGEFKDDVSYINAATYLQHYGAIIEKTSNEIQSLIKRGIDRHYENIKALSVIARSNLEVISSEVPTISKWVVGYLKSKIENQIEKENDNNIKEVINQFQDDLLALSRRLKPDIDSHSTPDFFSFPILAKIPVNIIESKINDIEPKEVFALCSILDSRFEQHYTVVPFDEESSFIYAVESAIKARDISSAKKLSDFLIEEQLSPLIDKLLTKE